MAAFRQVDADPDGVVEGLEREGAGPARGVEERGEGGPVQQRHPVRQYAAHVPGPAQLPLAGVQLAQQRVLSGRPQLLAQFGQWSGAAVEQLPQFRDAREASVHRVEGAEELGEDGGGAAGVAAGVRVGEVADQGFGEDDGGLVRVGGAAVQVEVVHGVRVADPYDDVVGVGRAEVRARGTDHDDRGAPGERVQAQRLGERPHQAAGLARAGRSDGQQGGAQQVGAEGEAGASVGVGVAGVVGGGADADLPGDQVVPGLPDGQVAGAGGVRAGARPVGEHRVGEGGEAVASAAHALPGAGDAGVVDVPHQSLARFRREPLGGVVGTGGAQGGPGDGVLLRGGRRGLGVPGGGAPGGRAVAPPDLGPPAEPGDAEHDGEGDHRVVAVPEDRVPDPVVVLAPGVGGEEFERYDPPAAQVAVPQQRPDQPAHQEGDQRAAEQLPARDPFRFLVRPGPVPEPPDAGQRLGTGGAQPGHERGTVRQGRRARGRRGTRWRRGRRRHLGWPRRARHRIRMRTPRVPHPVAVHRPCP